MHHCASHANRELFYTSADVSRDYIYMCLNVCFISSRPQAASVTSGSLHEGARDTEGRASAFD